MKADAHDVNPAVHRKHQDMSSLQRMDCTCRQSFSLGVSPRLAAKEVENNGWLMIIKEGSIPGPHPEGAHATTHGSQRVVALTVCARLVPQCPVRVDRHLQDPGHWLQEAVCVWAACMQESVTSVIRCHYLGTLVHHTSKVEQIHAGTIHKTHLHQRGAQEQTAPAA